MITFTGFNQSFNAKLENGFEMIQIFTTIMVSMKYTPLQSQDATITLFTNFNNLC